MPRWSPSPLTATCNSVRAMPSRAACAAIIVVQQAASDARKNQPGLGLDPPPPIEPGMSVSIPSPEGPVTRHFRPFTRVAVAEAYLARAFSGFVSKAWLRLFNAVAIAEFSIGSPRSQVKPSCWSDLVLGLKRILAAWRRDVSGNVLAPDTPSHLCRPAF